MSPHDRDPETHIDVWDFSHVQTPTTAPAKVSSSAPGVRLTALADEKALEGEPLDLRDRLLSLTFEDDDAKADRLTLQLANHDLALFEREDLAAGALLQVSWGYPERMSPPQRVIVRKLKGFDVLTLEAQALSTLLDQQTKTRTWQHVTRAQVVREVAAEHGWAAVAQIDDTAHIIDTINQAAETDARFLTRLAAQEGFVFYLNADGFGWHARRKEASAACVFTWRGGHGEVLAVQMESDVRRRVGAISLKSRDPLEKTTTEAKANAHSVARPTLAEVVEVVDPDTGQTVLQTRNATSAAHNAGAAEDDATLQHQADKAFEVAEQDAVEMSLKVIGDPGLRARIIVEVRGVGAWLSGKYYVQSVRHQLDGAGYGCDLKLLRDGTGHRARQIAQAQAQGGTPNTQPLTRPGALTPVEVIDPDTGAQRTEFRAQPSAAPAPGAADPEALSAWDMEDL
jgi:uncharacterized protein